MSYEVKNAYTKGKTLCMKNYEDWYEEAKLLYDKGSWGHAYALLFSGLEALTQAYCCRLVELEIWDPDKKEFLGVFNENKDGHYKRMKILHDFILSTNNIEIMLKHTGNLHILYEKIEKKEAKRHQNKIGHSLGDFRDYLMGIRNHGIYVDYNKETHEFSSPFDIRQEDVDEFLRVSSIPTQVIKDMIESEILTRTDYL